MSDVLAGFYSVVEGSWELCVDSVKTKRMVEPGSPGISRMSGSGSSSSGGEGEEEKEGAARGWGRWMGDCAARVTPSFPTPAPATPRPC
ncbi:hypothetical protein ACOMHN_065207 [Nucella lapillus]